MIAIEYFIAAFARHRSSDAEDHPQLRLRDRGSGTEQFGRHRIADTSRLARSLGVLL
jgi:hypothetical protein